jgi:hypothetical protein
LEGLLVAKSNEIVLAGRLGESLLTQQAELEARIRELEDELQKNDGVVRDKRRTHTYTTAGIDSSDDDVDGNAAERAIIAQETRDKLQALESELKRWERGNDEIYKAVGMGSDMSCQASQAAAVSCASKHATGCQSDYGTSLCTKDRPTYHTTTSATNIFLLHPSAFTIRRDTSFTLG